MLDVSSFTLSSDNAEVEPSDNIFIELGKNTYNYQDLISELIDNTIAARRPDRLLEVSIELFVDDDGNPTDFVIRDNASGISPDMLGLAISPAATQAPNSLNEHGLGMKQAVAALGTLVYLATKTEREAEARVVREFKYGDIPIYNVSFAGDSGTEIAITDLKPIVVSNATSITRSLIPYLGARYRRFLKPENRVLNLSIFILNAGTRDVQYSWSVEEEKPIYFHPSTRLNQPVISRYALSGSGWRAELTFGYAPSGEADYQELGLEKPTRFHPYYVSLSKQGLDLFQHDRVILFHQLSEIGIVSVKHNDYNVAKGELDLIEGFTTAITKNSIIGDENFRECIDKIGKILRGEEEGPAGERKNYLKLKTYPDQIPESLLRDRLGTWLGNNPLQQRETIHTEYVVEGIEGYIDIFADGEAWEIKTDQASARDVYQLFMYMDVGGIDRGYLVAKSFSTGAEVAMNHIASNHGKEITLTSFDQIPIIHPPNESEREEYYT